MMMPCARSADRWELLLAGRLLVGVTVGCMLGPMYVIEISPVAVRGAAGSVFALFVTLTAILAQVLGMEQLLGTETGTL